MTSSIEDRLRAHFADRTARETLPGPEADAMLQQTQEGGGVGAPLVSLTSRPQRRRRPDRRRWFAVAAAVALVAGIAGAVAVTSDDDSSDVSTDPNPAPTTTETDHDTATTSTSTTETTDPEASSDTIVPSPPAGGEPTGPFVAAEGMLGSWSGSAWVPWEVGATPSYGVEFQIVGLADAITTVSGEPGVDCMPVGNPIVDLGLWKGEQFTPRSIGITGVRDPQPRPVDVLDPSAYTEPTVEFLASQGIDDPNPQVSQALRSDIDGDGTVEVLVVAERISDAASFTAGPGDYAVAFLRRAVGGEVRTTGIAVWTVDPAAPNPSGRVYRVQALADLNGDGRMEIVIGDRSWEWSSTAVHELRSDGAIPEVLSVGCGV